MKKSRIREAASILAMVGASVPATLGQEVSPVPLMQAPSYPDHSILLVVRDGRGHELPAVSAADWNVRRDQILSHSCQVASL